MQALCQKSQLQDGCSQDPNLRGATKTLHPWRQKTLNSFFPSLLIWTPSDKTRQDKNLRKHAWGTGAAIRGTCPPCHWEAAHGGHPPDGGQWGPTGARDFGGRRGPTTSYGFTGANERGPTKGLRISGANEGQ